MVPGALAESSGTLCFLFTDIEGSTRLWEQHPEAMSVALKRHDQIVREAIVSNGGRVFKTVGDAFCSAFATTTNAVEAALAAQLQLVAESWPDGLVLRARMSVHVGTAEARDNDYFGQALNRTARLLAAGHGGQVLLSSIAANLAHDTLPRGCSLMDLGRHRLKDLEGPEHVHQLCHGELRQEFPPLRTLESFPNNLPVQVSSFVGREAEIETVRASLKRARVLTLTGSGGCGKTRVALEAAIGLLDEYEDGVWFVELAPVADPDLVPQVVATTLGLLEEPGPSMTRTVTAHLRTKRMILLLDNCEHLLDACARIVSAILTSCPSVSILATSRESLGVAGETSYRVPSLSLPAQEEPLSLDSIGSYEGVRLFVERAAQVQLAFTLTEQNMSAVVAICRRLDGIPLAIELAAARVRAMPVEQIEQRLDQRFQLLTGGNRSILPRQQTLRSAIDWSFNLIGEREKALLRRLSVFAGGWTLSASELVGKGDPIEDWEILDLLTGLVDKSLAVFQDRSEGGRYTMLETVREYALERLAEAGEEEATRFRHCQFFVEMAESAATKLFGSEVRLGQSQFDVEIENLRAAVSWSLNSSLASDEALRLVGALGYYWVYGSHIREGADWTNRALAMPPSSSAEVMANAYQSGMYLAFFQGQIELAENYAEASLHAAMQSSNSWLVCASLFQTGLVDVHRGKLASAEEISDRGLTLAKSLDDPWLVGRHLVLKGLAAWLRGHHEESRQHFQRTLQISREREDEWHIGITLANLACVLRKCGDIDGAFKLHCEGLVSCQRLGDRRGIGWHLIGVAGVHAEPKDFRRCAKVLGTAMSLLKEVGAPLQTPQQVDHDHTVRQCRAALGDAGYEEAWHTGANSSFETEVLAALHDLGRVFDKSLEERI